MLGAGEFVRRANLAVPEGGKPVQRHHVLIAARRGIVRTTRLSNGHYVYLDDERQTRLCADWVQSLRCGRPKLAAV